MSKPKNANCFMSHVSSAPTLSERWPLYGVDGYSPLDYVPPHCKAGWNRRALRLHSGCFSPTARAKPFGNRSVNVYNGPEATDPDSVMCVRFPVCRDPKQSIRFRPRADIQAKTRYDRVWRQAALEEISAWGRERPWPKGIKRRISSPNAAAAAWRDRGRPGSVGTCGLP